MNGTSIVSHADLPNKRHPESIACLKLDKAGCWNMPLCHFLKFCEEIFAGTEMNNIFQITRDNVEQQ